MEGRVQREHGGVDSCSSSRIAISEIVRSNINVTSNGLRITVKFFKGIADDEGCLDVQTRGKKVP